jgi:hypothetical protein
MHYECEGAPMKDTLGLLLREAWEQKGKPDCQHPEFSKEHSFSGCPTGVNICTTCGQLVQIKQPDEAKLTEQYPLSS